MVVMVGEQQEQQRNVALARANEIRTARKLMREQAKLGVLDVGEILLAPPEELGTMRVGDVIQWTPGIGEWRMKRIIAGLTRSNVKMCHLGEGTRRRLVERLREGGEFNAYTPHAT